MRRFRLNIFLLMLLLLGSCSRGYKLPVQPDRPAEPEPLTPVANVTYYGEIPCAECRVQKLTVSLFDDDSFRVKRVYVGLAGGKNKVEYDLGRWQRRGDKLVLRGSGRFPLQFRYESQSEIRLLDQLGKDIVSRLNYSLYKRDVPDFLAGPMSLTGMFSMENGKTLFVECLTGKTFSLVFERPDAEITRGYEALRSAPGKGVLATLHGRFELKASGQGKAVAERIMVQRFNSFLPGRDCRKVEKRNASLENTFWRLLSIKSFPSSLNAQAKAPYIIMKSSDGSVSGFSGCNRLGGAYTSGSARLEFKRLVTSRMACPGESMALEKAFVAALEKTASWRIRGNILELYDASSVPLMSMKVVTPQ